MDSKQIFSNRVDTYVKYRPSYPVEAIDYLYSVVGLQPSSTIADIGAGTGIFSKLLLARGSKVIAVEPNAAMGEAAKAMLSEEPNYQAVSESAEETGLPECSVDFIVCAQSFHWFDRAAAQAEFRRILKPGGVVILIWNSRMEHGTPFLDEYDRLVRDYGSDYSNINHKNITKASLLPFFKDGALQEARFTYRQILNFEELSGRVLSSSYMPLAGHKNYEPMMEELRQMFERNHRDGKVYLDYETELYWGEL